MRTVIKFTLALLAVTNGAWAGPLSREQISARAKWVVHFDAEHFQSTKLGQFYINDLLEKHAASLHEKSGFDFSPLLQSLKHATAYGTGFGKGSQTNAVLLLQAGAAPVRDFGNFISAHTTRVRGKYPRVVQSKPFPIFKLDKRTVIAPLDDGVLLAGQSPKSISDAWEVLAGRQPNLASTSSFSEFASPADKFVLAFGADGFGKNVTLPRKMNFFRKADRLRVILDERAYRLLLNVALDVPDAEAALRTKQMVEGLLAWAALEKNEEDAQLLVKSAKVTATGPTVSASFEYPVERAIQNSEARCAREKDRTKMNVEHSEHISGFMDLPKVSREAACPIALSLKHALVLALINVLFANAVQAAQAKVTSTASVREAPRAVAPYEVGVGRLVGDLEMLSIDQKRFRLSEFKPAQATVIAFISTTCPVSKRYAPTLAALERDYSARGVRFLFVNPLASDTAKQMEDAIRVHGFKGP